MTVRVLETTIRDGGYEISHEFTEEDVALVVGTLEAAGVGYIEVGHGMGVGAQNLPPPVRPKPVATSDEAHMRTGKAAVRRAKIGVLFVAGERFCPVESLDAVAAAKMDFVRLTFMPSELTVANMRYVERAKALGLTVSINVMQTYVLTPAEIAKSAAMARSAGADWWYVVDSAGGMQPAEIRQYVRAVLDTCDIAVGLHAHNNLGMAVANSLAAVEEGATLVDCTLNGLGRATGNAPTEQLILALQMMGHELDIDVAPIARLSSQYRGLFEGKGNDPMHFVSGASMLHSRNVPAVIEQAKQRGLSLADFMVRVGREARKDNCLDHFVFTPELFDRAAASCKRGGSGEPSDALVGAIAERITAREGADLGRLCEDLAVQSAQAHVPSVLHVVPAELFPFDRILPWRSATLVGATVPWPQAALGESRPVNYLVVDKSLAGAPGLPVPRERTYSCVWQDLWHDAIRAAVAATAPAGIANIWLPGGDSRLRRIAERLAVAGYEPAAERPAGERAIVVAASHDAARWTPQLRAGDVVIVIDRGAQARVAVDAIRRAGAHALTPPIASVIAARIHELVSLSSQVAPLLQAPQDAAWVDPLVAPGGEQAVVDLELASILDEGTQSRAELTPKVAAARARRLMGGRP